MNNNKSETAYKTIGEVTKAVGLIDEKTGRLQTHTIRYWETQFKQIKPSIRAGKRRYYSKKDCEIIKLIKNLLKHEGFTINGVKRLLNKHGDNIDLSSNFSIKGSKFSGLLKLRKNIPTPIAPYKIII